LQALKGTPVSAPVNLDEFRAKTFQQVNGASDEVKSIDPLAFLVGKVAMTISEQGGKSQVARLAQIHQTAKANVKEPQTGEN
jgi:hypothetical protein